MKPDNLKEALEQIIKRLEKAFDPERIILFGSYAYGEPTKGSDIDLLIVVPESNEPAYRRAQKAYECVGAVGFSKDLVVMTRQEFEAQAQVSTSLARRAMEKGEVCYERSKAR